MKALALTIASLTTLAATGLAQVANPSFEDPITSDGPPFVGFWEGFSAGAGSSSANSTAFPRTGLQNLELSIIGVDNSFAGAFQDIPSLTAGLDYTFSGYHATPSSPLDLGVEFRIEWRDSIGNVEISRTPNQTTAPGAAYSLFNLTSTVPAGADTARIVYAIQTFGSEPLNTGIVYVDDVAFALVPEPSTSALLMLGATALFASRRRRA